MLLNYFYIILKSIHDGQKYITEIALNKDHPIYSGHFAGTPVVPGVCMMMMVQETLGLAMGKILQLSEAKTVKFLGVVNPNENTHLTIECEVAEQTAEQIKVKATIYTDQHVFYKASSSFYLSK